MPGSKESLEILRKSIDKMSKENLVLMLRQLEQERKRRNPKKK